MFECDQTDIYSASQTVTFPECYLDQNLFPVTLASGQGVILFGSTSGI